MKLVWNTLQRFAYSKEEEPCEQEAQPQLNRASETSQRAASRQLCRGYSCKAGGTQHAIIVLGDALATEVTRTARTARGSFPFDMIETALMSQVGHV